MFSSNVLDTLILSKEKIILKNWHLQRTQEAFRFLGLPFSEIENCYDTIEKKYADQLQSDECLRIVFLKSSPITYQVEIKKIEKLNGPIKLSGVYINESPGPEAQYKWETRERWRLLLNEKKENTDDILLINSRTELIETSRFNIFCYDKATNTTYTPALNMGCLNGVFRRQALNEGAINLPDMGKKKIIEKIIKLDDLSVYQLFVGNSIRSALTAVLI